MNQTLTALPTKSLSLAIPPHWEWKQISPQEIWVRREFPDSMISRNHSIEIVFSVDPASPTGGLKPRCYMKRRQSIAEQTWRNNQWQMTGTWRPNNTSGRRRTTTFLEMLYADG